MNTLLLNESSVVLTWHTLACAQLCISEQFVGMFPTQDRSTKANIMYFLSFPTPHPGLPAGPETL